MSRPQHCVLVGPRGAGKSRIGRELAAALGWELRDSDEELAARVGRPAGRFLAEAGEARFREVEAAVVQGCLAASGPRVTALGGGAVLDPEVRGVLGSGAYFVVFLLAPREVLAERCMSGGDRPALTDLPLVAEVEHLWAEREPFYREVADFELDTNSANVHACVAVLVDRMRGDI